VLPDSPEFQELSKDAALLLYTLKVTMGPAGIDVLYDDQLCERSRLSLEELGPARQELIAGGWLTVERRVHWLRNGLRFEPTMSLKNANHRKSVQDHLGSLPKQPIVNEFASHYDLDAPFPKLSSIEDKNRGTEGDRDGMRMPIGITEPEPDTDTEPDTEPEAAGPSKEHEEADGVAALASTYPEAAAALARMQHRGGRSATAATLRTRFLYDGEGHELADPSVGGQPFGERLRLVAAALIEMADQGKDWNTRTLAGFVRNLARKPPPDSEAASFDAEAEKHREIQRRMRAHEQQEIHRLQVSALDEAS